jgi:hypothetical protein
MRPYDLEIGNPRDPLPPVRISSIRSDGEGSNDSNESIRTDEPSNDSLQPPKRPAYHTYLLSPTRSLSSTSTGSYVAKGKSWTCASCSYKNVDYHNTMCALCGYLLNEPPAIVSPLPDRDRAVVSNKGRVSPVSDRSISSIQTLDSCSTTSQPNKTLSGLFTQLQGTKIRRTSSSSVGSQGSASTVKASNRVEDHFWRSRSRPERIDEAGEGIQDSAGIRGGSHRIPATSRVPDSARHVSSRMVPLSTRNTSTTETQCAPTLSQSSPSPIRPPYRSPVTCTSPSILQYSPSNDSIDHRQRMTDIGLLAPSEDIEIAESSSLDQHIQPSTPGDRRSSLNEISLDDFLSNNKTTTSATSEASIFAPDPAFPWQCACVIQPRKRTGLIVVLSLFCVIIAAVAGAVTLTVTRKSSDEAMPFMIANPATQPPDEDQTNVPPPTFELSLEANFEQLGQTNTGGSASEHAGSFIELANSGTVMAVSSAGGIVRLYALKNDAWIQVGQDIDNVSSSPSATPIALASQRGRVVAVLVNGFVHVYEFDGTTSWQKHGDAIDTGARVHGSSLSLSADGSILAVATPDAGSGTGRVRIFSLDASIGRDGKWKVLGSQPNGYSGESGLSVDLSYDGHRLVVGTWRKSKDSTVNDLFRVRSYQLSSTNSWELYGSQIELQHSSGRSKAAVSFDDGGNMIAACTLDSCRVFMFNQELRIWEREGKKLAGGEAVSLSAKGGIVAVGTGGVVQVYNNKDGDWSGLGGTITGLAQGDCAGQAVAISGTTVAIGCPKNDSAGYDTGIVQVFSYSVQHLS